MTSSQPLSRARASWGRKRRTPAPEKTILKASVIAYFVLFGILMVAMWVHLKGIAEEGIRALFEGAAR